MFLALLLGQDVKLSLLFLPPESAPDCNIRNGFVAPPPPPPPPNRAPLMTSGKPCPVIVGTLTAPWKKEVFGGHSCPSCQGLYPLLGVNPFSSYLSELYSYLETILPSHWNIVLPLNFDCIPAAGITEPPKAATRNRRGRCYKLRRFYSSLRID